MARSWQGSKMGTHHYLRLLDTRFELGDVALRLIFGEFIDLVLLDDSQRLFRI